MLKNIILKVIADKKGIPKAVPKRIQSEWEEKRGAKQILPKS